MRRFWFYLATAAVWCIVAFWLFMPEVEDPDNADPDASVTVVLDVLPLLGIGLGILFVAVVVVELVRYVRRWY